MISQRVASKGRELSVTQLCLCGRRSYANHAERKQSSLDYCVNLVRVNDYENYLCTLRLPKHARVAAFAIRAFNVEVAKVKDSVSDSKIGKMRLQFWRDVLHEMYNGKSRAHPVVALLFQVIIANNFNRIWFSRLINAREKNLDDEPFLNIDDIESYGENSISPVFYLILESLGIKDMNTDHVVSHICRALSLTTVLRSVPYNAQQRKVILPMDLLLKHKVSQEDVIRLKNREGISDIVYELACQAHTHLQKARSMKEKLSKDASKCCLPVVPCSLYLDKLQSTNFDVFHPLLQQRQWTLPFKIYTSSVFNRF